MRGVSIGDNINKVQPELVTKAVKISSNVESFKQLSEGISTITDIQYALYAIKLLDAMIAQSFRHKCKNRLVKHTIFDIIKKEV